MVVAFVIAFLGFLAIGLVAAALYLTYLSKGQDKKDIERGLKMVPLFIHLPPPSADTNIGGRDERDVVDETISKAQIIYNIIASTLNEDKKSKYTQKQISFEIVGYDGFVHFYASVPISLIDIVKQAVVSAYPSAQLEQVAEHNIFNGVGGMTAVFGGEMKLKQPYAFPIATYQDLKRDAMKSLLNAMASLDKEDGIAIQLLFRPAKDGWRKTAGGIADKKKKGKYDDKKGIKAVTPFAKELVTALSKPPENSKDNDSTNDLSGSDRAVVDAIEDKTRYVGFETMLRIVVSSNVSQRAQSLLQNVVASFSLYDAPGKNGFKFEQSKDTQQLVNQYLLRIFPKSKNKMVLNAVELATLFHFPDQNNVPTSQVVRQESKQVDGPRNIPEKGLLLGYNIFRGAKKPIRLALQDRQRHMYVVGQTGTGKSTFLENLALQDMLSGNGFAFVDPHGDTAERLLSMVPRERVEDVIYFCPAEMDYPMGLNLFEFHSPDQKDFLVQETLNMLQKLYDPQHTGIMGPRYEHIFRNAALVVMADPSGGTFIDIPKLFRDPQFLKQKLQHVKDQTVLDFWQKEYPASQRSNDAGEVTAWFVSKFGAFLSNEMMRNIIGQTKSALNLREIMDNKKILLVNLSKGRTGDLNSKLLGMIFVMKFQAAAMSRASIPEDDRVDFSLYVDEFQNFSTDSFATIMSEARKFHLNLIVANQFTTQLTEEIRDAVFGNIGTIVSFRIGQNDVEGLGKYFHPVFDADDLLRIPNYNTIVRTLINGVPTQPFSMATLPVLGAPNPKLASALKQLSAVKYGKTKASVEKIITERMKTIVPPLTPSGPPSYGNGASPWGPRPNGPPDSAAVSTASTSPYTAAANGTVNPNPPSDKKSAPSNGSSFLDEWLQKRQKKASEISRHPSAYQAPATPEPVRRHEPPTGNPVPRTEPSIQHINLHPPQPQHTSTPRSEKPAHPHEGSFHPTSQKHPSRHTGGLRGAQKSRSSRPSRHSNAQSKNPQMNTKNISSEELDKKEIGGIADELKRGLRDKVVNTNTPYVPNESKSPKVEVPTTKSDSLANPVVNQREDYKDNPSDTIMIDDEGNLIQKKP